MVDKDNDIPASADVQTRQNVSCSRKYINVVKSENDDRLYRYIELENSLHVLLISDSTTEKAAAAVDVFAGNMLDPDEVPGIAHFCEHMLFLGTEKYKQENEFTNFLSQNGGRSNASTNTEHTKFFFDIKSEELAGAIDRFAQFFLCPLFTPDATERELNAIESEHQNNLLQDNRRIYNVNKVHSKEGHPFRKFGTGSLETLKTIPEQKGIDIRQCLLDYHSKYYSANIMKVAVIGRESLDELENLIAPLFSQVINKNVTIPVYNDPPFGENELGIYFQIKSIKEIKSMELKFPVKDYDKYYKEKPVQYVSHLIGHEGKGSLLSLLKKKSLVNSLSSGYYGGAKGFSFFQISMELTDEGLRKRDEIITYIFQYINLLKKEGPKKWIFDEMKMLDEITFRFKGKVMPLNYVLRCAANMQYYPGEDVLYGGYKYENFAPHIITEVLDCLHPNNFRYIIAAHSFDETPDKKAEHYGTEYSIKKIPGDSKEIWMDCGYNDELALPQKNDFIPTNISLKFEKEEKLEKQVPTILKDNELVRIWYKADDSFFLPKSCIDILVYCPMSNKSPYNLCQLKTFSYLLNDDLSEVTYDAEIAGIPYSFYSTCFGISIKISGFNDKQHVLLNKIMEKLISPTFKEDRFNIAIKKIEESLRNAELSQPFHQLKGCTDYLIEEDVWSEKECLEALKDVTFEGLKLYHKELLRNVYLECLIGGNITPIECHEIVQSVEQSLFTLNKSTAILPIQHMITREYCLHQGCSYLFEKRSTIHAMSCVQIYLQAGLQETRLNVLSELFASMIKEPCFDTLRTKEQLGYIVFSFATKSVSSQGFKVIVQSDKPPSMVEQRIEKFLLDFEETLDSMTDESFQSYVDGLAVRKLEKPKHLRQEFGKYLSEILYKQYKFHRQEIDVEELRKLTIGDVKTYYKQYISPKSSSRKKLAVVILGKDAVSLLDEQSDNTKKNWQPIDDILAFKASLSLYPLIPPANGIPWLGNGTKAKL